MAPRPANARYKTVTEAAKIYQCTVPAVRYVMKPGGALAKAVKHRAGKNYIDMEHKQALAYRSDFRRATATAPESDDATPAISSTDANIPEDIRKVWDWTIERVYAECGSAAAFDKLMAGIERVENIHKKRLDSDRLMGDLISRDYVRKHVLGLVEKISQRLLNAMPIALSYTVHGNCGNGATAEEIQQDIIDAVGREIGSVKADVTREIKNASE